MHDAIERLRQLSGDSGKLLKDRDETRGWNCQRCAFCGVIDTLDNTGTCRACIREFYADE